MKTKTLLVSFSLLAFAFLLAVSCSKEPDASNVNSRTVDLNIQYQYDGTSPAMGQLGRVLFYDKSLSLNNAVSCGSCHLQSKAFADDSRFSKGFENLSTDRNTPPIQNLNEVGQALFWDGRERVLQNMVMQPIFNHVEMGMRNTVELTNKVASKGYYKELFHKAYGSEEITFAKISEALSGFTQSIVSRGSKFDQSVGFITFPNPNTPNTQLNLEEQKGFDLFFTKYDCGSCHNVFSAKGYDVPINFGISDGSELVNIGLDANYSDNGLGQLTGDAADDGKFKIPNLRNVALTAPYMHDGRFTTLDEVIEHYNTGIQTHPNLDSRLRNDDGTAKVMNITAEEKSQIIAFLNSLTDMQLIQDPKFSDPFIRN